MAVVSYQPWYTSQTFPVWDVPLTTDNGNEDLTGVNIANFTMIFRDTTTSPPNDRIGTGVFSIKVLNPAEVYYKPSVADVANPFSGFLIIKALFPPSNSTADEVVYDPIGGSLSDPTVPFKITAV